MRPAEAGNALLRSRLSRLPGIRRPRYRPWERFQILLHRARYGLSVRATARAFVLLPESIRRWARDAARPQPALARPGRPISSLTELTAKVARELRRAQVSWGSRRISMTLTRLGLACSRSSVQRILRKPPPRRSGRTPRVRRGPLIAETPNEVWLADLTQIGILGIARVHIGAVLDLRSRKVVAWGLWRRTPTGDVMVQLIREGIRRHGSPRHLVTDQGTQFTARVFVRFLRRQGIRHRYGAVKSSLSVSVMERFWRSFKQERAGVLWAVLPESLLRERAGAYVRWYNAHRPHGGLAGETPDEVFHGKHLVVHPPRHLAVRLAVRYLGRDQDLPIYRLTDAA